MTDYAVTYRLRYNLDHRPNTGNTHVQETVAADNAQAAIVELASEYGDDLLEIVEVTSPPADGRGDDD
jgi:hypothetical protein